MMKKIGLILFFVCLVILFCCPGIVNAASTTVCLADSLNIFDPARPDINFTVSGDPYYYYDVAVWKWTGGAWNLKYHSGTLVPSSTSPGTYTHLIPPGTLEVDGSIYAAQVAVHNGYVWSPWAEGYFILNKRDGQCGTSAGGTFCPYSLPSLVYPQLCLRYNVFDPPTVSGSGAAGTTWSWTCSGQAGGDPSPACTAQARIVESPNCGSVMSDTICSGSSITLDPSRLCTIYDPARPPVVTGNGTTGWNWTCSAECNQTGLDKACTRYYTERIIPTCGDASGQNYCYEETQPDSDNLCSPNSLYQAGSLENNYTEWTWNCNGICPTSTTVCHAGNSHSCGWIETN
jgi:hypothetical protein